MQKIIYIIFVSVIIFMTGQIYSQDNVDENNLFSNEETVVNSSNVIDNSLISNIEKKSVSLSGQVQVTTSYNMTRDYINGKVGSDKNTFMSIIEGNIFLDIRLLQGIKSFANISAFYSPQGQLAPHNYVEILNGGYTTNHVYYETNNTLLSLKEFFIDANVNKAVYFRGGKQVLQWGSCYFWNPSDLINVQRKNYFNMSAYREGSYGIKTTVPFGTAANIYTYFDFTSVPLLEDTALAGKVEFLLGGTEISLSGWSKKNYHPVFGGDFTSRVFSIDIRGEVSLSDGDTKQMVSNNGVLPVIYQRTNQLITKAVLGFTKTFDLFDIQDRLSITGEFFYNGAGYSENVFTNDMIKAAMTNPYSDLYVQNYHSMYYGAFFASFNELFVPQLTLNLNGIMNFVDYSFVISPGLSYNPVFDFTVGLSFNIYGGNENCEYTYSGNSVLIVGTATLLF